MDCITRASSFFPVPAGLQLDAGIQEQRDIEARQRRMLARRVKRDDGVVEEDSDDDSGDDMVATGGSGGQRVRQSESQHIGAHRLPLLSDGQGLKSKVPMVAFTRRPCYA